MRKQIHNKAFSEFEDPYPQTKLYRWTVHSQIWLAPKKADVKRRVV
jgi:hypothetical protein